MSTKWLAEDWRNYLGRRLLLLPLTVPIYAVAVIAGCIFWVTWRAVERLTQ